MMRLPKKHPVVAILSETFSPKMGYIQNALPKFLARLGVEVHLITEDLPPYYRMEGFHETYGEFIGGHCLVPGSTEHYEGFTIHVQGHQELCGYMRMRGLFGKLASLRPDVVQCSVAIGWIPLDAAVAKLSLRYKLFTGSHVTASVFPLANRSASVWDPERIRTLVTRAVPGRLVSLLTEKCYGATVDCGKIAGSFFGVQESKIDVCPLGVDTDQFWPVESRADLEARSALRRRLGYADSDIVCIYSGRFSPGKDPLVLASAIERLADTGSHFRGLFLGAGTQATAISGFAGCQVKPFVPFDELSQYFRAADIGVWPKEESMSMIDAAASGLPIVVNDAMVAVERIRGNGVTYSWGDPEDLARVLLELSEPAVRRRLGQCGAQRMRTEFSWDAIARRRLRDYEAALSGKVTS